MDVFGFFFGPALIGILLGVLTYWASGQVWAGWIVGVVAFVSGAWMMLKEGT